MVYQSEVVFVVEDIEVCYNLIIFDILATECHSLVEEGKGIAHRPISLLCQNVQSILLYLNPLFLCYVREVFNHVGDRDPVEIVGLAPRKDSWEDLMLFCSGQNEDSVCRRFLKCLQEGVESGSRQHVHLVDDIYAVLADLRWDTHHLCEIADIIHRVV